MGTRKTVLIFEPDASGHHPSYLKYLLINFLESTRDFDLVVLVHPDFLTKHPQIVEETSTPQIKWVAMSHVEVLAWQKNRAHIGRLAETEWSIWTKYATRYQVVSTLIMYFDYFQWKCLWASKPPCPVLGILFRPTLVNYPRKSFPEKVKYWQKYWLLRLVLGRTCLYTLFCLDDFCAKYMTDEWQTKKVQYLPDPVKIYPSTISARDLRSKFGLGSDRVVFLIFGHLNERKGGLNIIEALKKIPRTDTDKACLWIVGSVETGFKGTLESSLETLKRTTDIQVVVNDSFVDEEIVQPFFEASDYILAVYSKHVGMSGVLVRAAAAKRPVVALDYGLMGRLVRENNLGWVVKNTEDLAERLKSILVGSLKITDCTGMETFAQKNRADNFAKVILDRLDTIAPTTTDTV